MTYTCYKDTLPDIEKLKIHNVSCLIKDRTDCICTSAIEKDKGSKVLGNLYRPTPKMGQASNRNNKKTKKNPLQIQNANKNPKQKINNNVLLRPFSVSIIIRNYSMGKLTRKHTKEH